MTQYYEWWFRAFYSEDSRGTPDILAATSLDQAFVEARRTWPTAIRWVCLGRVNSRDRERHTKVDSGVTERVVRNKEAGAT